MTGHAAWPVGLALVLRATAVAAAEPEAARESVLEERVEVRAALPVAEDVAAFATTIDGDEIVERGEDLADLLRRVPGARIRDYGGLGSYAVVSLRGSTSEQVTVLVDGVPQNRALGGPVDLSAIPATQVERVTVFRGFGPAGLGLGGIGGVVDVRTRAPGDEPRWRVDALAGQLDTQRLSSGLGLRTGRQGSLRIALEALESDGDFRYLDTYGTPFTRADDRIARRRNDDVEQGSLLAQHVQEIGDHALRVGLRVQRRDRGVPGTESLQSTSARLREALDDATLSWTRRGGESLQAVDLLADGFRQEIRWANPRGDLGLGVADQTTSMTGGGVAAIARVARGRHGLVLRADARHERADVRDRLQPVVDRGGAERDLARATVEDLIRLGRWTLAPSLGWTRLGDTFRTAGDGTISPLVRDTRSGEWSGKLGAACRLGTGTTLRASLGRFHRSPSLLELFGDRGAIVGNPALRPESGRSAELGLALRRRRGPVSWRLETVAFGRRSDDLIRLVPNSQAVSSPRNVASSDVYGVEIEGSASGPWNLRLDFSGTLQRSEDSSTGKPLLYQPEQLGWVSAAWRPAHYEARWDATYVGENSADPLDAPEVRQPARLIHDATLAYRLRRGLELGLDVRNVFDRRVRDVARYPLPARVVFLHLGWTLGAEAGG